MIFFREDILVRDLSPVLSVSSVLNLFRGSEIFTPEDTKNIGSNGTRKNGELHGHGS
jgi:hypothetical protein